MVSEETPPNVVNSEMHYEQCYMASPCYKNWKSDSHVAYPAGTNGYRWGMCRECDLECICQRLLDFAQERNEP